MKLQYNAEALKTNPKLILIRDYTCATRETLMNLIENNNRLNEALSITKTDQSTNVIVEEYNSVNSSAERLKHSICQSKCP